MNKQTILEYCMSYPNVYMDYPYGPACAVFRYQSNNCIFALVYERDNKLCVELICDYPDLFREAFDDVLPGHRMKSLYWSTVIIGGDVGDTELFFMIWQSYELVRPKLREHNRTLVTSGKPWPVNFYCYILGIAGRAYPDLPSDPYGTVELALDVLTQREKEIILARYKDYMTYGEIGAIHHISGSRVAQIHYKVMRKIRKSAEIREYINNINEL